MPWGFFLAIPVAVATCAAAALVMGPAAILVWVLVIPSLGIGLFVFGGRRARDRFDSGQEALDETGLAADIVVMLRWLRFLSVDASTLHRPMRPGYAGHLDRHGIGRAVME